MLTKPTYLRLLRASAVYDLVITAPFATPWTFVLLESLLRQTHERLGLPGILPVPDPMHVLFANLMGSVVVIWSIVRLHLGLPVLGRYDAAARTLFSAWMLYALAGGFSAVIVPILIVEIAFGIGQSLPWRDGSEDIA
ncbi:hypothetical protein [Hoeflea sp.]|uniref:hypothetical protein n=1 Tax=Hoeflea sp. TaxID=1940281 RepID=UPI003A92E035